MFLDRYGLGDPFAPTQLRPNRRQMPAPTLPEFTPPQVSRPEPSPAFDEQPATSFAKELAALMQREREKDPTIMNLLEGVDRTLRSMPDRPSYLDDGYAQRRPAMTPMDGPDTGEENPNAPTNREAFVKMMLPHVQAAVAGTNLDPRLVLAQSILETGDGRAAPGNNYFGIKSHGRPGGQMLATTEVGSGGPYSTRDSFRRYSNPGESARDYVDFLRSNGRYASVLGAKTLAEQIEAMGRSGYATDPNYAAKLRSIAGSLPGYFSQG